MIVDIDMFDMGGRDADPAESRECILIGTTGTPIPREENEEAPRRFIAVSGRNVDLPAFWRDRDQLFAEAVASLPAETPHRSDNNRKQLSE